MLRQGNLAGTFLYPPPGQAGLETALKIIKGEKASKRLPLPAARISADNAEEFMK